MLCLRTTPLDDSTLSPADLLNSRVYQSNLQAFTKPTLGSLAGGELNVKLQSRQDQQKSYYDHRSRSIPLVYLQDPVRVFDSRSKTWKPGIIKNTTDSPRSFVVDMADGATLVRNRRHLHRTGETNITAGNS